MKINTEKIQKLKFDEKGLIPAVIQDVKTGTVLMVAYMNRESLEKTLQEGRTYFFSRSRQALWAKGDTSGHIQKVDSIHYDCDADTLLVLVYQTGAACHEGTFSCFSDKPLVEGEKNIAPEWSVLSRLEDLIKDRKEKMPENSYTTYLFEKGIDKILKKIGEETAEVIIAAKGGKKEEVVYETADLIYHLMVMLREQNIDIREIWQELAKRHKE